jgi:hypothetical protein
VRPSKDSSIKRVKKKYRLVVTSSSSELHLEGLEVRLVLKDFDERLKIKTINTT